MSLSDSSFNQTKPPAESCMDSHQKSIPRASNKSAPSACPKRTSIPIFQFPVCCMSSPPTHHMLRVRPFIASRGLFFISNMETPFSVLQESIKAAVTESTISLMTTTMTQTALNTCCVSPLYLLFIFPLILRACRKSPFLQRLFLPRQQILFYTEIDQTQEEGFQ